MRDRDDFGVHIYGDVADAIHAREGFLDSGYATVAFDVRSDKFGGIHKCYCERVLARRTGFAAFFLWFLFILPRTRRRVPMHDFRLIGLHYLQGDKSPRYVSLRAGRPTDGMDEVINRVT